MSNPSLTWQPHSHKQLIAMSELLTLFLPNHICESLSAVRSFSRICGGSAALAAAAAARLGIRTRLIAMAGTDPFSEAALKTLQRCGVHTDTVLTTDAAHIGKAFCCCSSRQLHWFYDRLYSADLLLQPEQIEAEWFAASGVLHFSCGGLRSESSRLAHRTALQYACTKNAVISFDFSTAPDLHNTPHLIKEMHGFLPLSHIIWCTETELPLLIGNRTPQSALPKLTNGRTKLWIVEQADGSITLYTKSQQLTRKPISTERHNLPGERSAFIGGFLYSMLLDHADPRLLSAMPTEILSRWATFSALCAAYSRSGIGAAASFPTRAQLDLFLKRGIQERFSRQAQSQPPLS